MKRINFQQVILGMIFLAFFNSCAKEECQTDTKDSGQEASVRSEETILIQTAEYIHNGSEVKNGDQIRETETTNVLIGYQGSNYVFDNDTLLRNWTLEYTDRTRIREALDSMNYLKTFADTPEGGGLVAESIIPRGWLYRDINRGGNSWPIKGFSYGNNKNKASSFIVILTGGVLCDKTWFRGAKVWLYGAPGGWANLSGNSYNFNDRAESGWDL